MSKTYKHKVPDFVSFQSCVANQLLLNSEKYRMRRNQLEFKLEEFRENEQNTYTGYIDANKPEEILHEMLVEFHKIYGNDTDFNEFCNKVINFDEMRFGDTCIKLVNTRKYNQ